MSGESGTPTTLNEIRTNNRADFDLKEFDGSSGILSDDLMNDFIETTTLLANFLPLRITPYAIERDGENENLAIGVEAGLPIVKGLREAGVEIAPGMAASAEIRTDERRVIDYLLCPICPAAMVHQKTRDLGKFPPIQVSPKRAALQDFSARSCRPCTHLSLRKAG